ncbi:hypothetical protein EDB81DRAFT_852139 [Dactylonectria macrodidyma]|uniref:Uncharacterized protein n=1 Tax=Dactylonectria macrodidyma TaxID=307937 RepID=A0A9P9FLJ1_9HYPO|nr:hypothetical protein EDB81DRAFT_852139 [Dactylonectria macrodidyma]
MSGFFRAQQSALITPADYLVGGLVLLITLPYHRFFLFNTLQPALKIDEFAARDITRHTIEREKLHALLLGWRVRKKDELGFVSIAGITITAIVTASFSWSNVQDAYWVASGFWYATLMTSVCGILIAAQQMSLLALIGELPADPHSTSKKQIERQLSQLLTRGSARRRAASDSEDTTTGQTPEWQFSWRLIFTWQCPMMFIGYSTLFYFIGLTVVVAMTYLTASGVSWGLFAYCSLGGYQAISLSDEDDCETVETVEMVVIRAPHAE